MTSTWIQISAERMFGVLREHGFRYWEDARGNEIVFARDHDRDPRYKILVYTSIRQGDRTTRPLGAEAIRVCAVLVDGKTTRGICSLPRVHRAGSADGVLARVLERARQAYLVCNGRIRDERAGVIREEVRESSFPSQPGRRSTLAPRR